MSPVAGGGETEREPSPWTVDSTRESISEVLALRDRVDAWRDRLYDERERHRREVDVLREQMHAQRFDASQEALAVLAKSNAETFAGFPQRYALLGETNAKITTLEQTIASLVAASQTRTGSETALVTQRTERRLSTNALIGVGLFVIAVLTVVVPLFTNA